MAKNKGAGKTNMFLLTDEQAYEQSDSDTSLKHIQQQPHYDASLFLDASCANVAATSKGNTRVASAKTCKNHESM